MLNALRTGKPGAAEASFKASMAEKVNNALDSHKVVVASQIYSEDNAPETHTQAAARHDAISKDHQKKAKAAGAAGNHMGSSYHKQMADHHAALSQDHARYAHSAWDK